MHGDALYLMAKLLIHAVNDLPSGFNCNPCPGLRGFGIAARRAALAGQTLSKNFANLSSIRTFIGQCGISGFVEACIHFVAVLRLNLLSNVFVGVSTENMMQPPALRGRIIYKIFRYKLFQH